MKLLINNTDYTPALDAAQPITVERTLNAPSSCRFALSLPADASLAASARMQRIVVSADDGTLVFTGYIAAAPIPAYVGVAMEGPRSRLLVEAVSDEILLDQAQMATWRGMAAQPANAALTSLVTRTAGTTLATGGLTLTAPVDCADHPPGEAFGAAASRVATQACAAYRALNGSLSVASIPGAVHSLSEIDGTLTPQRLSFDAQSRRALANDVTICGEHEPAAYVSEFFQGDGVTTQFYLGAAPYSPPASQSALVNDLFDGTAIDARIWNGATDAHFALDAGGLAFHGGAGIDGQTELALRDPVEMGGTLLMEAEGVALSANSTGVLAGFFAGAMSMDGCVAGFQVTAAQGSGAVSVQPLVRGVAAGTASPLDPAQLYTLRIRVHCPEHERTLATYRAFCNGNAIAAGGQTVAAPARLQFELQECVNGVLGMPVTLYECSLDSLPSACTLVAASSINLQGHMRALRLTSLGSAWVVSTPSGGSARTRRLGTLAQSAECEVRRGGKLVFFSGFVPAAGELIEVRYRTVQRAMGRAVNADTPQCAYWIGTAKSPPARSSADCRSSASALLQAASSADALWSGAYRTTNFELDADVWPGDALALDAPSCGVSAQMIVRSVRLTLRASVPEIIEYAIRFANAWAEDLAVQTSAAMPRDADLPVPVLPAYLPNLQNVTATISGNSITINTGVAPPAGGGFEVRRRDGAFMPGVDADLVLRGSQQTLIVARTSSNERYYVRMYDASTPPNYSEFSAAVFVNV